MLDEQNDTKREVITTTISFGDGRAITIEKTLLVQYRERSVEPVRIEEAGTILRYDGFSTESMSEFNALYARRREPGAIDEIEKFVERHRVYQANVIGDPSCT